MRTLLVWCLLTALVADEALVKQAELDPAAAVPLLITSSRELTGATPSAAQALADRLDPLARRLFLHGWQVPERATLGLTAHTVAAGDSLSRIGKRWGTPVDLLIRLNPGADPRRLAVGARIAVLDAKSTALRLEVRLPIRRLLVWRGSVLVLACPVGIGAVATPTPTGTTQLAVRAKDPEWRDPLTGTVHPPRSPGNRLGGYWLGFEPGPAERFRSIGCHGWTGEDPDAWLGQPGSQGCLRLRQADIADLYALVLLGTAISIL